jgi:hypothetical protein
MAAEYGLIVMIAYLGVLASTLGAAFVFAWQRESMVANHWTATAIAAAAFIFPLTELTNSHFFHVRLGPMAWILFAGAASLARTGTSGDHLQLRLPSARSAAQRVRAAYRPARR